MNLITLMCRWLNSASKVESDRYFSAYYKEIIKTLKPTVERQLSYDKDTADEILNDLCMRLCERINARPQAYKQIESIIPSTPRLKYTG